MQNNCILGDWEHSFTYFRVGTKPCYIAIKPLTQQESVTLTNPEKHAQRVCVAGMLLQTLLALLDEGYYGRVGRPKLPPLLRGSCELHEEIYGTHNAKYPLLGGVALEGVRGLLLGGSYGSVLLFKEHTWIVQQTCWGLVGIRELSM